MVISDWVSGLGWLVCLTSLSFSLLFMWGLYPALLLSLSMRICLCKCSETCWVTIQVTLSCGDHTFTSHECVQAKLNTCGSILRSDGAGWTVQLPSRLFISVGCNVFDRFLTIWVKLMYPCERNVYDDWKIEYCIMVHMPTLGCRRMVLVVWLHTRASEYMWRGKR